MEFLKDFDFELNYHPGKANVVVDALSMKTLSVSALMVKHKELRKMILEEGHRSCLSIHPRATKMYKDLKKIFWWPKMKKDVAEFVLTEIYIKEIVKLHGIPSSIVSNRDPRFTSKFWQGLHSALGTNLRMSSAYHPQTDGQTERTNQSLEDLLRACVLEQNGSWDSFLPLIEFTYNNSFHSNIGMTPFEALCGRRCRTPLCWFETSDNLLLGPAIVQQTTSKVKIIQEKMRASQSRQKIP
ncbi:uncharacterized protein [Cicer arietinum]|uniref:uncharacterized protein n=1 Tax=Cicer arietinum TaxID=3827 RepID=UPI003CC60B3A